METRSLAYIGLAFLTLTLGQAVRAEEFSVPPHECVDEARGQLYSVDPPWFSGRNKIDHDLYELGFSAWSMKQLSDLFDLHDKKLVVVPMLPPAVFAPAHLSKSGGFDRAQLRNATSKTATAFAASGASVLNLSELILAMPEDIPYQRPTDHHWSAEGAARSAQFVSSKIFESPFPRENEWRDEFEAFDKTAFEYLPPIMRTLNTDLCDPDTYKIQDYSVAFPRGIENSDLGGEDLFGSSEMDSIAVLGSSYSAGASGNVFPEALAYYSKKPVVNYSLGGGGAASSLVAFIEEDEISKHDIEHVVWVPAPLHERNEITGAALLGAGLLTGACKNTDLFFSERQVSASYGEWIEVPEIIGLANRLDILADRNEKLEFKASIVGQENPVPFHVFFGSGYNLDEPYTWSFRFPTPPAESELRLIKSIQMRVVGFRDYQPSGALSFKITSCSSL